MLGSSGLSHHALAAIVQSFRTWPWSRDKAALPEIETYFCPLGSAKARQTAGSAAIFLVAPRVGQEIDLAVASLGLGGHRPRADRMAILRRQHAKADLLSHVPNLAIVQANSISFERCSGLNRITAWPLSRSFVEQRFQQFDAVGVRAGLSQRMRRCAGSAWRRRIYASSSGSILRRRPRTRGPRRDYGRPRAPGRSG